MSLFEIGKKYPTNKNISGFVNIYDSYFDSLKNKKINILEIGVDNGDSLRLWRDYFPNANICGIDIVKKDFLIDNVEILCGDQSDIKFLSSIIKKYNNFDVIIDDGSHVSKHIISSFNYLFDHLNNDGFYVVEDLQTSYFPRYGGNRLNLKNKKTAMNFLKSLADSVNYEHNDRPFFKRNKFDGKVKYINFHQNIAFIKKGESENYFYKITNNNTVFEKIKKLISLIFN